MSKKRSDYWGVSHGHLKGPAPTKGSKLPKGKEQMPFQTWDEIQAISDRGGLTAVEQKELWDCLFLTTQINEVLEVVRSSTHPWRTRSRSRPPCNLEPGVERNPLRRTRGGFIVSA